MVRAVAATALLVGSLLGSAFPQETPPAPPPAPTPAPPPGDDLRVPPQGGDDRVPITNIVETWWKFEQSNQYRGYIHETISPVPGRLYRYEYLYEGDLDRNEPLEGSQEYTIVHVSWRLTAQLEEDFDPYSLDVTVNYGPAQMKIEIRTSEEKGRIVEIALPQTGELPTGEVIRAQYPIDQHIPVCSSLMMYRLRQSGALSQPKRIQERVIGGPGGNDITINVKVEQSIESKTFLGQKDRFVTQVSVENAPSEMRIPIFYKAFVDKYGRIVEAEDQEGDGARYTICGSANEARGGEQSISQRGRRDPFVKIGAMTPVTGRLKGPTRVIEDPPLVIQPSEVNEKLVEVNTMMDQLERSVKDGNTAAAEALYQKFLRHYEVLRKMVQGDPLKLDALDHHKIRAEQLWRGAELVLKRARALLEGIEDYYNALNDKGAQANLEKMLELRRKREFFQDKSANDMDRLIRQGENLVNQTKARIELQGKKLVLSGTIMQPAMVRESLEVALSLSGTTLQVQESVKLTHSIAYAIINNELYRENEEILGQGVLLEKIQPHGVTITYKGEVRTLGLKKSGSGADK